MEEKVKIKRKEERGITLIALVITIVILIILATVTLNVVLGEGGLIQRAQQAKELTEQAALEEQQELNSLMDQMANIMGEGQTPTEPPKETMPIEEAKPTPSEDGTKVEEGIVIEDDSGNQFVWIPVGEYNVSATINSAGKLTNELTRREFTESASTPVSGDSVIEENHYGEGDSRSVAKDQIEAFKSSSTTINTGNGTKTEIIILTSMTC